MARFCSSVMAERGMTFWYGNFGVRLCRTDNNSPVLIHGAATDKLIWQRVFVLRVEILNVLEKFVKKILSHASINIDFCFSHDTLQGILMDRGSSGRPAVVTRALNPHFEQETRNCPQRKAGYGKAVWQVSSPGLDTSISTPFGNRGSGAHCGSRPASIHSTVRLSLKTALLALVVLLPS